MPTILFDIPWPPSTNRLWRTSKGHTHKSAEYRKWIKAAQSEWYVQKVNQAKRIDGEFSATLILNPPDKRRIDIDNRIKAVLDLAQSLNLIENDHLCRRLLVEYGSDKDATPGASLILRSW